MIFDRCECVCDEYSPLSLPGGSMHDNAFSGV